MREAVMINCSKDEVEARKENLSALQQELTMLQSLAEALNVLTHQSHNDTLHGLTLLLREHLGYLGDQAREMGWLVEHLVPGVATPEKVLYEVCDDSEDPELGTFQASGSMYANPEEALAELNEEIIRSPDAYIARVTWNRYTPLLAKKNGEDGGTSG